MPIYNNVLELVGNTPVVRLNKLVEGLDVEVLVKLEYLNPGLSVKDRIGVNMIEEAERSGLITPGKTTIIEPTSGNTGVALAFVCAAKGYKLVLCMPDTMSTERRMLLRGYGASIELTEGAKGMRGAVNKAMELHEADQENTYIPQQFENVNNPAIHVKTTAREIMRDLDGKLDFFVSGVGTGGTITGVASVLKAEIPNIKIIAVEPSNSPVIAQTLAHIPLAPAPHKIQGIGAGFIPGVLNTDLIDEVMGVSNESAVETARDAMQREGLAVGISSGASIRAAIELAQRPENKGKRILAIVPSNAERYLSTILFDHLR
jgi:cysteine synthase A